MATIHDDRLECEVFIKAPPETVFPFLTDPDKITQWIGTEADSDPRPGGIYRVNVTGDNVAKGAFVEVTPNQRVVFTWGWEGGEAVPPGASQVEITLTPQDSGTLVRLVHSGLSGEWLQRHGEGWDHYIARLEVAAAGGSAGVDPWTKPQDAGAA